MLTGRTIRVGLERLALNVVGLGLRCYADSGKSVSNLYFWKNGLNGTIPSELGNLSNLTYLHLGSNSLTGTIPSELGNLTKLTAIYLYSNALTGTIPSELDSLTKLTTTNYDRKFI